MPLRPACATALALLLVSSAAAAAPPRSGIDATAIDRSVRPGDDFDAYASGAWRARAVIPADKQGIGTIEEASDRAQERLRPLIENGARAPKTVEARLIGDLYSAYMDEVRIEAVGDRPLIVDLARVRAVSDKAALAKLMGPTAVQDFWGQPAGSYGKAPFVCDVWVDLKDPTKPVLRLKQDGLGMGYREAYGDAGTVEAYRAYVERTLALVGWPEPAQASRDIVAMEKKIADGSWTVAENGDRLKRHNPMSRAELAAFAPGFPWDAFLRGLGAEGVQTIFVQQKSAMPKIAAVWTETPLETLKAWEAFQLVDIASPYLSNRFAANRFSFRGKVDQGLEQEPPRWRRGLTVVDRELPFPLGREYVARYLTPEAKAQVEEMAANFKAAMAARIRRADWMSASTKAAALVKLDRVRYMVGRPDSWRDYSGLRIDRADLYGAVAKIRAYNWAAEVGSLGQPADPAEWVLPPQVVDGFSDQSRVAIGVPAGMLQAPLFDEGADPAANYGGIGELLGHELTHQFDDQGRKYGATGAIHDWWTQQDAARFEAEAKRLADQFSAIEPLPGIKLNGRQTLSENIADLGGLLLALDAYHLSLKGRPAPVIDGLTGDQRVFLAWARVFRSKERNESLKSQAQSGTHTPFKFRSIGPMRNIDAWYQTFDVKPGDRFYLPPAERARVW